MNRPFIISIFLILFAQASLVIADMASSKAKHVGFSVEYLHDKSQYLSVEEAVQATFLPTTKRQCFDLNNSTAWYKVVVNNTYKEDVSLAFHNNKAYLSRQVELYTLENNQPVKLNQYDFFDVHVGDKLMGSSIVYPFLIAQGVSQTFYIRNKSLAYQCIDIDIFNKQMSLQALINKDLYSNAVIVTLLVLALYNLLLYFFIRRKEFVFYVFYLLNAAVGLAYYYGSVFHHFQVFGERVYWLNITAILVSLFLVLFVQAVFDTKKSYRFIHLLLTSVLVLSVLDIGIAVFIDLGLAVHLVAIVFAYSFFVLAYMAIKLYQDKHPLIMTFSLAYTFYIIGMAIVLLMFMGYLPLNEYTFHSSGLGIIMEAFLFSYLLHYRVRLLVRDKVKAEGANKRKTRFLASASHDLRQPVHALELFSEALSNEELSKTGKKTLAYLKDCVASLNELLSSLLDISRLDAGIVEPKFEDIEVFQLLKRSVNNLQGVAEKKGLYLHLRGREGWVVSDNVLLENTVRNLLDNAIKYTQKGGVLIACRIRRKEVWIEIWDSGIGISELELENIFDEFYQVNHANCERKQGLGLGLSIVRREMEMLSHSCSVHSRVGRGTLVRIKLQRVNRGLEIQQKTRKGKKQDRLLGLNVLVIDDEELVLIASEVLISQWGCNVEVVVNLNEARDICRGFKPDVIISDFRLKDDVTGIIVIEQLRRQLNKNIPAILMTGDTAPDRLQQALDSGLTLLHKPVKSVYLKEAINLVLK